jgi:branched-chain amino acid transport system permease protein
VAANPRTLLIFLALLGLWGGASGSKVAEPDSRARAAVGGLTAGGLAGLMVAAFSLVLAWASGTGANLRTYFAALSPEGVQTFLLEQTGPSPALTHFGLLLATGLVGALLAHTLRQGTWRGSMSDRIKGILEPVQRLPLISRIARAPATRPVVSLGLLTLVLLMPQMLGQYWNYNMGTVGIYVLLGLGLNIVVGLAGLLDLGYVAFFAVGAYAVALLTAPEPHGLLWPFWVAMPIGVALASLTGILLGIPVLRMRGDYLAIVTLGFGEIIRILLKSDVMTPLTNGPRGVGAVAGPTMFGHPFSSEKDFMYLIILGILLVMFITSRLQDSRTGRAWVAIREDETVARAMGIDTLRYKLLAFAIGAAFAGVGGALFASRNQFTGPEDHTLMVSINVLCLVIVGGMGSIPGVILGAFVLKALPEILRQLEDYRILAFGALLVAMMVLRPEGLWPSTRRRLEMRAAEPSPPPNEEQAPAAQVHEP